MLQASLPIIALLAFGLIASAWRKTVTPVAATALALGAALLALVLLVVLGSSASILDGLLGSPLLLLGLPLLCYALTLVLLTLRGGSDRRRRIWGFVLGIAGLYPLYTLGGYVLISAACWFQGGGC